MIGLEGLGVDLDSDRPVEPSIRAAANILMLLQRQLERDPGTLHEIARQGVFVWPEGHHIGIHAKPEKGRIYEARIHAALADEAFGEFDMQWIENGEQRQVPLTFDDVHVSPELFKTVRDIHTIERMLHIQEKCVTRWHTVNGGGAAYRTYHPGLPN